MHRSFLYHDFSLCVKTVTNISILNKIASVVVMALEAPQRQNPYFLSSLLITVYVVDSSPFEA